HPAVALDHQSVPSKERRIKRANHRRLTPPLPPRQVAPTAVTGVGKTGGVKGGKRELRLSEEEAVGQGLRRQFSRGLSSRAVGQTCVIRRARAVADRCRRLPAGRRKRLGEKLTRAGKENGEKDERGIACACRLPAAAVRQRRQRCRLQDRISGRDSEASKAGGAPAWFEGRDQAVAFPRR
ncbi:unnamed protein product, partial [Phaeothamnion confervicola]